MKNIIVTNCSKNWEFLKDYIDIVTVNDYLNLDYANTKNQYRVINLCNDYDYQSLGYYVSLISEARRHKVYPSILNIQDINQKMNSIFADKIILDKVNALLKPLITDRFLLSIYFGKIVAKKYDDICKKIHSLLPLPLFRVEFSRSKKGLWSIKKVKTLDITDIPDEHIDFVKERAKDFVKVKRMPKSKMVSSIFDLAILYNPSEAHPPSNKQAIENFIQAGNELGMSVDLIDKSDYQFLARYDGLFIRETTFVNHYTYNFARKAFAEGMVVVDDPRSILKCGNKVYLNELLQSNNIDSPHTDVIFKASLNSFVKSVSFPCVLKQPDSCFSHGVVKINDEKELIDNALKLFKKSEILLVQDYIKTEYDWRIGVLDGKVLYACKYYMAKDHWQIYNWESKDECEGEFECLPVEKVPVNVIKAALKSSKLLGNGLYGVDIKEYNGKAVVIEVNDNPSIDAGIEDQYVGKTIYLKIMQHFIDCMKKVRGFS